MKFALSISSLVLLFVWCLSPLSGQVTLSGELSFSDDSTPEGAIVRMLESDSVTMIDFASVGADGRWQMTASAEFPIVVEASFFGYKTEFLRFEESNTVPASINFVLKPQNFKLEEVTVKDKAIGVTRVGDTLTFNLEIFTTGAERTLSDVIDRLPGMEIRDGSVYYGGEVIGRMLVQGRDIINSNQKLATEGIRADQLQEIKIIENYKVDGEEFESTQSQEVAMDVRLKEDELNKWSGTAELLGGYPSSAKADINAFNLNDKIGLSGFLRGNNIGEQALTFQDMMSIMDNRRGLRYRISGSEYNMLVPPALNISDQVQSNLDAVANLNVDWDASSAWNVKGFVTLAYAERESEVNRITEYLAEKETRTETETSASETPLVNTMWRAQWKPDTNTFLDITVPVSFNVSETVVDQVGQFESTPFQTQNDREEQNFSLLPSTKFRRNFGPSTLFVDAKFSATRNDLDRMYEDLFPFLGVPVDGTNDPLYTLGQDRTTEVREFNAVTSYKHVMGDWFVEPGVEYGYLQEDVNFEADKEGVLPFDVDDGLRQNTTILSLRGGYETDGWEIIPSLALNVLDREFDLEGSHEETFMGYSLTVLRKFNRAHRLSFTANYDLTYPQLSNVWNINEVNSATNLRTGQYPLDLATTGYDFALRYNNYIPDKNIYYFTSLSYEHKDDVVTTFTESFGSYILQGFVPTASSDAINGFFFLGFELPFAPIRLQPRVNINYSEGFATNRNEQLPTENLFQSYSFGVRSRWDFPLNVRLDLSYNINEVKTNEAVVQNFESWMPGIGLDYTWEQLKVNTRFDFQQTESGPQVRELYLWDFDISYELKNAPFTLRVQADNILNITPRKQINNSFNTNTATVSTFDVFPGFILGGFSWNF